MGELVLRMDKKDLYEWAKKDMDKYHRIENISDEEYKELLEDRDKDPMEKATWRGGKHVAGLVYSTSFLAACLLVAKSRKDKDAYMALKSELLKPYAKEATEEAPKGYANLFAGPIEGLREFPNLEVLDGVVVPYINKKASWEELAKRYLDYYAEYSKVKFFPSGVDAKATPEQIYKESVKHMEGARKEYLEGKMRRRSYEFWMNGMYKKYRKIVDKWKDEKGLLDPPSTLGGIAGMFSLAIPVLTKAYNSGIGRDVGEALVYLAIKDPAVSRIVGPTIVPGLLAVVGGVAGARLGDRVFERVREKMDRRLENLEKMFDESKQVVEKFYGPVDSLE